MCSIKFAQIYLLYPAGPSTHINKPLGRNFFVISVFLGLEFLTEVCLGWSEDLPWGTGTMLSEFWLPDHGTQNMLVTTK